MTTEALVVSCPNPNGRYFLLPMLDLWTDEFASPGWRTTGTAGGELLLERPQERHIACGIQSGLGDRMPAVQRILFNPITAAMGL